MSHKIWQGIGQPLPIAARLPEDSVAARNRQLLAKEFGRSMVDHIELVSYESTARNGHGLVADIKRRAVLSNAPVPKAHKRLFNKPLPRLIEPPTPAADIKRAVLSEVYRTTEKVSEKEEEEEEEERRWRMQLYKEKWQYWRSDGLSNLWKEKCCTIRYGYSGTEFATITRKQLENLKNRCTVYRHIRELLQLPKHISLKLYFAECHTLRKWQRHEVWCDDSPLGGYLEGAVLEAVVHP